MDEKSFSWSDTSGHGQVSTGMAVFALLISSPIWGSLMIWNGLKRAGRKIVRIDRETRQSGYEW